MAMPRRIPIDFHVAFPNGGYLVSEVVPVHDFERSTADTMPAVTVSPPSRSRALPIATTSLPTATSSGSPSGAAT